MEPFTEFFTPEWLLDSGFKLTKEGYLPPAITENFQEAITIDLCI
jgi:hypothetical protein